MTSHHGGRESLPTAAPAARLSATFTVRTRKLRTRVVPDVDAGTVRLDMFLAIAGTQDHDEFHLAWSPDEARAAAAGIVAAADAIDAAHTTAVALTGCAVTA